MMKQKKNKIWLKVVSLFIIQAFILFDLTWAYGGTIITETAPSSKSTLAPHVQINNSDLHLAFEKMALEGIRGQSQGKEGAILEAKNQKENSFSETSNVRTLDELIKTVSEKKINTAIVVGDWNVARDKKDSTKIKNDEHIQNSIPTLNKILGESDINYIFFLTHSGRPKGQGYEQDLSLGPIKKRAEELIKEVSDNTVVVQLPYDLKEAQEKIAQTKLMFVGLKIIFVLENIRFYPEEKSKEAKIREEFKKKLIELTGQTQENIAYINEAFDKSHREKEASMELVSLIPAENRAAGLNLAQEIRKLIQFEQQSKGKTVAIFGGAKFDKYAAMGKLAKKIAQTNGYLAIVGALAHPYLASLEKGFGKSKMPDEKDKKKVLDGLVDIMNSFVNVIYPKDFIYKLGDVLGRTEELSGDMVAVDIGEDTFSEIYDRVQELIAAGEGTLILNGGAGIFKNKESREGTKEIILLAEKTAKAGVIVFAVGGDMNTAIDYVEKDLGRKITDRIIRTTGGGVVLTALHKGITNLAPISALMKTPNASLTLKSEAGSISKSVIIGIFSVLAIFIFASTIIDLTFSLIFAAEDVIEFVISKFNYIWGSLFGVFTLGAAALSLLISQIFHRMPPEEKITQKIIEYFKDKDKFNIVKDAVTSILRVLKTDGKYIILSEAFKDIPELKEKIVSYLLEKTYDESPYIRNSAILALGTVADKSDVRVRIRLEEMRKSRSANEAAIDVSLVKINAENEEAAIAELKEIHKKKKEYFWSWAGNQFEKLSYKDNEQIISNLKAGLRKYDPDSVLTLENLLKDVSSKDNNELIKRLTVFINEIKPEVSAPYHYAAYALRDVIRNYIKENKESKSETGSISISKSIIIAIFSIISVYLFGSAMIDALYGLTFITIDVIELVISKINDFWAWVLGTLGLGAVGAFLLISRIFHQLSPEDKLTQKIIEYFKDKDTKRIIRNTILQVLAVSRKGEELIILSEAFKGIPELKQNLSQYLLGKLDHHDGYIRYLATLALGAIADKDDTVVAIRLISKSGSQATAETKVVLKKLDADSEQEAITELTKILFDKELGREAQELIVRLKGKDNKEILDNLKADIEGYSSSTVQAVEGALADVSSQDTVKIIRNLTLVLGEVKYDGSAPLVIVEALRDVLKNYIREISKPKVPSKKQSEQKISVDNDLILKTVHKIISQEFSQDAYVKVELPQKAYEIIFDFVKNKLTKQKAAAQLKSLFKSQGMRPVLAEVIINGIANILTQSQVAEISLKEANKRLVNLINELEKTKLENVFAKFPEFIGFGVSSEEQDIIYLRSFLDDLTKMQESKVPEIAAFLNKSTGQLRFVKLNEMYRMDESSFQKIKLKVPFEYYAPGAQRVYLVGDFNVGENGVWIQQDERYAMVKGEEDGVWRFSTFDLDIGTQYKFIVIENNIPYWRLDLSKDVAIRTAEYDGKIVENNVLTAERVYAGVIKELYELKQEHLFENWESPGESDIDKKIFFETIIEFNETYPRGLRAYLRNAKELLDKVIRGVNPFEGYFPEVPEVINITEINDEFYRLQSEGLKNAHKTAVVMVAGGVGDRLGFQGIKVGIPLSLTDLKEYIQLYIDTILAIQRKSNVINNTNDIIPFTIMTSVDTHDATIRLLIDKGYSYQVERKKGRMPYVVMEKGDSLINIVKQGVVPAIKNVNADLCARADNPYALITKPHGHGDVHMLLAQSGLVDDWAKEGRTHIDFIQDTNGQVFNGVLIGQAVSKENGFKLNFLTVLREAREAAGAITKLVKEDGTSIIGNVEYNELDPLFKDVFKIRMAQLVVQKLNLPDWMDKEVKNILDKFGDIASVSIQLYEKTTRKLIDKGSVVSAITEAALEISKEMNIETMRVARRAAEALLKITIRTTVAKELAKEWKIPEAKISEVIEILKRSEYLETINKQLNLLLAKERDVLWLVNHLRNITAKVRAKTEIDVDVEQDLTTDKYMIGINIPDKKLDLAKTIVMNNLADKALLRKELSKFIGENIDGLNMDIELTKAILRLSGDNPDPKTGKSPYPGNLNVFIVEIGSYNEILHRTQGIIGESIHKFTDGLPTRPEVSMQDVAFSLGKDIGCTNFLDKRDVFSPVKNAPESAAQKPKQNLYPDAMATGEADFYRYFRKLLNLAGVKIDVKGIQAITEQLVPYQIGAKVVLSPQFAVTVEELLEKIKGGSVSNRSTLWIEGEKVKLDNLNLDGALIIKSQPGSELIMKNIRVQNAGWQFASLRAEQTQDYLQIRGYDLQKQAQVEISIEGQGRLSIENVGFEGKVKILSEYDGSFKLEHYKFRNQLVRINKSGDLTISKIDADNGITVEGFEKITNNSSLEDQLNMEELVEQAI